MAGAKSQLCPKEGDDCDFVSDKVCSHLNDNTCACPANTCGDQFEEHFGCCKKKINAGCTDTLNCFPGTDDPCEADDAPEAPCPPGSLFCAPARWLANLMQNLTNQILLGGTFGPDPCAPGEGGDPGSFRWCFSKDTKVAVKGKGAQQIDALKIGDEAWTSDGAFHPVHSFGHFAPNQGEIEHLQIHANATQQQHPLEITKDHLLHVRNTNGKTDILPAGDVKAGDFLVSEQQLGESAAVLQVMSIQKVPRIGAHAPFPSNGKIVVNGAAASNFIALPPVFQNSLSHQQQHWIQHAVFTPNRLHCGRRGCENETCDGATGLSKTVTLLLPVLRAREIVLSHNGVRLSAAIMVTCCMVWKLKPTAKPQLK